MKLFRFSLLWAFAFCCFCLVFDQARATEVAPGQNFEEKRPEKAEEEPQKIIRRHGFERDEARKATTLKIPANGGRSKNIGKRDKTPPKEGDQNYGYLPKAPEDENDPLIKFGPPPRRYDLLPQAAAPEEIKKEGQAPAYNSSPKSGTVNNRGRRSRDAALKEAQPESETAPAKPENDGEPGKTAGPKSRKPAKSGDGAANASAASSPGALENPARLSFNTSEDMNRAYRAFDYAYENSLGKTRKELSALWGFPLQKIGGNQDEAAYGFRQRGVLGEDPALAANMDQATHHYTSGDARPGEVRTGRPFACLMILWIDKGGRGVVIDGDAVGDCFLVEALAQKPVHFER